MFGQYGERGRGHARRGRGPARGVGILLLALLLAAVPGWQIPALSGAAERDGQVALARGEGREEFSFVYLADPHMGSAAGNRLTPQVVGEVASLAEQPAFVVVGGDLTELGGADQYDVYDATVKALGVPVYATPGNHDSRWLDAGKARFKERYGAPYYDFEYGGIHFVVLDNSVSNQTHGHFERAMLEWLRSRLASWGRRAPVVLFMHHPVGYPGQRFVDNEQELLGAVEGYRVVAAFTGHGHVHAAWRLNGIPFFMAGAAMEGKYALVKVSGDALTVWACTLGEEPVLAGSVPLDTPGPAVQLQVLEPQPDSAWQGDFTLRVRVTPPEAVVEYRVDGGPWTAAGVPGGEVRTATVSTAGLAPGFHDLSVRAALGAEVWTREVRVRLAPAAGGTGGGGTGRVPSLAWRFRAGSGIQSAPVVDGERGAVYFGSNDGFLRCLGLADGALRWQVATAGPVLGSPCLADGVLYFGSADGVLRAVDAATGGLRWQFPAGAPVLTSPACAGGTVYFGDGAGVFHALDAGTGRERWRFTAGGPIRSRAALARGMVFFGCWDGRVYALEAGTGRLVWERNLARQIYYAPSIGDPLCYLDRVYVTTPADPHAGGAGLHALDPATGDVLWQSTVPAGFSSPEVQDLAVVVSTAGGRVVGLNPLSGEPWWEASTGVTVYESAAVPCGGDVVVGGLWGEVVAVRARTGEQVWRYRLGFRLLVARAAVAERYLLVPSLEGYLYALRVEPSPLPAPEVPFRDVAAHWAREGVTAAARLGLVQGYGDGTFRPAAPVTRAELVAVLARYLAAGAPAEGASSSFADVAGHWALEYILALEQRGIVRGEVAPDGTARFRPDDPVTRAELAALLARARGTTAPSPGFRSRFADIGGSWARDCIAALEEQGLLRGAVQGKQYAFRPLARATRAEVAVILGRLAGVP